MPGSHCIPTFFNIFRKLKYLTTKLFIMKKITLMVFLMVAFGFSLKAQVNGSNSSAEAAEIAASNLEQNKTWKG